MISAPDEVVFTVLGANRADCERLILEQIREFENLSNNVEPRNIEKIYYRPFTYSKNVVVQWRAEVVYKCFRSGQGTRG